MMDVGNCSLSSHVFNFVFQSSCVIFIPEFVELMQCGSHDLISPIVLQHSDSSLITYRSLDSDIA